MLKDLHQLTECIKLVEKFSLGLLRILRGALLNIRMDRSMLQAGDVEEAHSVLVVAEELGHRISSVGVNVGKADLKRLI